MQCSMFGKLPSKRDFVSYNMPRPFLDHWEEWLQTAVAVSQLSLGSSWQNQFLVAPIWRFWFGSGVFGQQVTGALMPSVDGVGRYFPLSLCACATPDMKFPPPPDVELDAWHEVCEHFLLGMLDDQLNSDPSLALSTVPVPPFSTEPIVAPVKNNPLTWQTSSGSLSAAFAALKTVNDDACHAMRTYWWTTGGGSYPACLVAHDGIPEPEFLTQMITGDVSR